MNSRKKTLILDRSRRVGLLLNVGLALWLVWAVAGDAYLVRLSGSPTRDADRVKIQFGDVPSLDSVLNTMRQREVFRQSVFYETKKTDVADSLGDLVFLGTVQSGDTVRAFIRNNKTQQSSMYSAGETIDDITIKEIRPDCAIVVHGEETVELR